MLQGRRAVSEVMGSLIILLIVSTLGTFLYNYTLNVMGFQQSALQEELKIASNRAQERLKVIAIWLSNSSDLLNITILNYGEYDTKVVDIYVNGMRANSYYEGKGEQIATLGLSKISFYSPIPMSPETLYELVIVSERGVAHVYRSEY